MIHTKHLKDQEGYLLIDHRHTEGVPDEIVTAIGLPAGAGRGIFESATFTCSHCNVVVVMNPKRTRERTHCRGCNHLICDGCAAIKAQTLTCKTYEQIIDEVLTKAAIDAQLIKEI